MLSSKEKQILNLIQDGVPLASRPFLKIGKKLNLSEVEILEIINKLKEKRIIKNITASFNYKKLGFYTTLAVCKIPKNKLEKTAKFISSFKEATHNYSRVNEYNLWFTIVAPTKKRASQVLSFIKKKTGLRHIYSAPSLKEFKVKVKFKL